MASTYDADIDQGADWQLQVTYTDDAGTAINLTGYTARMQVRRDYADREESDGTSAVLSLTSSPAAGITITPSTGIIDIAITAAQTVDLEGQYLYDLEIESGAGVVTRLIEGRFTLKPEVTR